MNPQMNITAHQNRLDTDSEQVYDHLFFSGLDGVAAALDNVEASENTTVHIHTHTRIVLSAPHLYVSLYKRIRNSV